MTGGHSVRTRADRREEDTALQLIDDLPDDVVGVRAVGEVEDDEDVLVPAIELVLEGTT